MPNAAEAVACLVVGLLVTFEEIQRLLVIRPLHAPVSPFHQCPVLFHFVAFLAQIGRPLGGAGVIATGNTVLVLVKNIKCHAVRASEHTCCLSGKACSENANCGDCAKHCAVHHGFNSLVLFPGHVGGDFPTSPVMPGKVVVS